MTHTPLAATDIPRVRAAVALARVLQRLEHSGARVDADQYRLLVDRLAAALDDDLPAHAVDAILQAFPSAAELYENRHYRLSGLSRAPLEQAVAAELATRDCLARFQLRRPPADGLAKG